MLIFVNQLICGNVTFSIFRMQVCSGSRFGFQRRCETYISRLSVLVINPSFYRIFHRRPQPARLQQM